jgi:predicted nuclease of predicted toxin-antitoxin system
VWREIQAGRKHRPHCGATAAERGHDVSTVTLQSLNGTTDENLFEVCIAEQRALVTLDHDFGQCCDFLRIAPPES